MVVDGADVRANQLAEVERIQIGLLDDVDELLDSSNVAENVAERAEGGVVGLVSERSAQLRAAANNALVCIKVTKGEGGNKLRAIIMA